MAQTSSGSGGRRRASSANDVGRRRTALDRLWAAVAHICRLDEKDPEAAWAERVAELKRSAEALTERCFDAIHLTGPGTDLRVGLYRSSTWVGADFSTIDGVRHYPNIPTEEVFTVPDPMRVDGHVSATMPPTH